MPENLTDKQEKFVLGVLAGMSQREAYRAAYNSKNMSDAVVDVKASELLNGGKVAVRYNELRGRLREEVESEAIITAKEVISEVAGIAKDDISNYLDFYPGEDGRIIVSIRDSRTIDTRNISEISIGKDGTFKFKLYSKLDALEKLARHLGLYNDSAAAKDTREDDNLFDAVEKAVAGDEV